jgi:lysophospholipase L1-like esterase
VQTPSTLRTTTRWSTAALFLALLVAAPQVLAAPPASAAAAPKYLLALGDSLAAGYQPKFGTSLPPVDATSGFPDKGYPGGYAADVANARGLDLVDLGCPGETTTSMLTTPAQRQCGALYSDELGAPNQLNAAETFLRRHPGKVAAVTIDLGSNDLQHCVSTSVLSTSCLKQTDIELEKNLAAVLAPLVALLGQLDPAAHITSMNYYDPFLGLAFSPGGTTGLKLAAESLPAIKIFNTEILVTYRLFGLHVAQVASSFDLDALLPFGRFGGKTLPRDVVETCELTWMCPTSSSQGPADIHPNDAGYRLIASAFEHQIPASVAGANS